MDKERAEKINKLIKIDFFQHYKEFKGGYHHYTIDLQTEHGKARFPYFQGTGIKEQPHLVGVLYCLVSDAQCYIDFENDYHAFQREFGYSTQSEARKILNQCASIKIRLDRLGISDHLEEIQEILQDY